MKTPFTFVEAGMPQDDHDLPYTLDGVTIQAAVIPESVLAQIKGNES